MGGWEGGWVSDWEGVWVGLAETQKARSKVPGPVTLNRADCSGGRSLLPRLTPDPKPYKGLQSPSLSLHSCRLYNLQEKERYFPSTWLTLNKCLNQLHKSLGLIRPTSHPSLSVFLEKVFHTTPSRASGQ